jgi:hypothetical protein
MLSRTGFGYDIRREPTVARMCIHMYADTTAQVLGVSRTWSSGQGLPDFQLRMRNTEASFRTRTYQWSYACAFV